MSSVLSINRFRKVNLLHFLWGTLRIASLEQFLQGGGIVSERPVSGGRFSPMGSSFTLRNPYVCESRKPHGGRLVASGLTSSCARCGVLANRGPGRAWEWRLRCLDVSVVTFQNIGQ